MAVKRIYQASLYPTPLLYIAKSLGCHVACKLAVFNSQETTLTDELCDMFLIWSNLHLLPPPPHELPLNVTLTKTTQSQESLVGFDFSLRIITPQGQKTAILQAKVYESKTGTLRGSWDDLRKQLILMRSIAPDMFFLLVYVPASDLDSSVYQPHITWEQSFYTDPATSNVVRDFGISVIEGNKLLNGNRWRRRVKVQRVSPGVFNPSGISFARLLTDMLLCNIGGWTAVKADDGEIPIQTRSEPRLALTLNFQLNNSDVDQWQLFLDQLRDSFNRLS